MNKDSIEGSFKELQGQIKKHWGKLTDDDLHEIDGKVDALYGKIQKKYGYTKKEVKAQLESFLDNIQGHFNKHSIGDGIRHTGNKIQELSHDFAKQADSISEKTHDTMADGMDSTVNYVKKNPVKSILIGLSAGFIINRLLK